MLQMTIIGSLITTLIFSSVVLKILGDVERSLPTHRQQRAAVTCEKSDLKSDKLKDFDPIED